MDKMEMIMEYIVRSGMGYISDRHTGEIIGDNCRQFELKALAQRMTFHEACQTCIDRAFEWDDELEIVKV